MHGWLVAIGMNNVCSC